MQSGAAKAAPLIWALVHDRDMVDQPSILGSPDALQARLAQIHEDHISPLTAFVERLRIEAGPSAAVPYFDPWDGGIDAELLFLLEAPGPKAVNSGFVSQNNPDLTAKNLFELFQDAKIKRKRIVVWNIVPWYIGSSKKIRAATTSDVSEGMTSLNSLVRLLPKLRAIVMLGKKSQTAQAFFKESYPNLALFSCPHPSPLFVNRRPENRDTLVECLKNVQRTLLDPPSGL